MCKPVPPSWTFTSWRCLLTAVFGMLAGLQSKWIPHGERTCRRDFDWSEEMEWKTELSKIQVLFCYNIPVNKIQWREPTSVMWVYCSLRVCGYSFNLAWRSLATYLASAGGGWRDGTLRVAVWGHLKYSTLLRFSENCTIFRQVLSMKELSFHHPCFTIFWDGRHRCQIPLAWQKRP